MEKINKYSLEVFTSLSAKNDQRIGGFHISQHN